MKALWSTLPGIRGCLRSQALGGSSSNHSVSNTLCEVRRSRVLVRIRLLRNFASVYVEFHEGVAAHINTTSCEGLDD